MKKYVSWYTLVELIVTVTVMAILTTIASIYLFDYFKDTRDASRVANLQLIWTNLELYYLNNNEYPNPDNFQEVTFSWSTVWKQWVFWDWVGIKMRNFWASVPRDERFDVFYSYSITNNRQEYQVATITEWWREEEGLAELVFVPQAEASVFRARVIGNYNRFMVMANDGDQYTFIWTPSIIASDLTSTDIIDIISWMHLVYDDFYNLPASYQDTMFTNWWFDFNVLDPVIFSWSLDVLRDEEALRSFTDNLRFIYARTPTEYFSQYATMLQEQWLARFRNYLQNIFWIQLWWSLNCQDMFDSWEIIISGIYTIRPSRNQTLAVFCDVRDTTAFTRIDWSFLGSGWWDFSWGNHILTHSFSLFPTPAANQIIAMSSPVNSWYVMRQQWINISNYEVKIQNFSELQVGDELRLSLWARWDYSWTWSNNLWFNPQTWYLFHNRIFYTDGTFSTNGELELIESRDVGGQTWNRYQVRHQVRKSPQDFSWYIWLDAADTVDFYFTWVNIEVFRP